MKKKDKKPAQDAPSNDPTSHAKPDGPIDFTTQSEDQNRRQVELSAARLIVLINAPGDFRECMSQLTVALQEWSGCQAVGVRLRDGEDYPYYETRGFPPEFVQAENSLCAYGPDGIILRDGVGNPVFECMCGNILSGRFDSTFPFFTTHGSFWSNSTTALLASTTDADRQTRTRNRCNGEGYESVALIPLRTGQNVFGLLQFNDHRPNRFTPDLIDRFEKMADSLAMALAQRQTEEALRQSEERYRTVADFTYDWEYWMNPDGDLIYVSPSCERITGFRPEELQANPELLIAMIHPEDRPKMVEHLQNQTSGEMGHIEFRIIEKNGRELWISHNCQPVHDASGRFIGRRASNRDINDRKRAEEAIKKSEEKFSKIFKASPESISITAMEDGRYIEVNDVFLKNTGFQRDEVVGHTSTELNVWVDANERNRYVNELIRNGFLRNFETRYRMREGEVRDFLVSSEIIELEGKPCSFNFILDVTDRKRVEETLRASEENYRNLFENANEAIFVAQEGTLVFFNPMAITLLGYTREELPSKSFIDFIYQDDRDMVINRHVRRMNGEDVPQLYSFRVIHKDGSVKWVELNAVGINWKDKRATLNFVNDISERKQAEDALRESSEQLSMALEVGNAGIWEWNLKRNEVHLDDRFHKMLGYTPGELPHTMQEWLAYHHPEDIPVWMPKAEAYLKGDSPIYESEHRIRTQAGTWDWVFTRGKLVSPEQFIGIAMNITEHKEAEEQLRQSEEKFRDLVEDINDIIYTMDAEGRFTYVSPAVQAIFGYSPEEFIARPLGKYIHPEDRPSVMAGFHNVLAGIQKPNEYRVFKKSGEIRWIRSSSKPIYVNGILTGIKGIATDITEEKLAQDALRESEEKYRNLFDNAVVGMYRTKIDGSAMLEANQALCDILERTREELSSQPSIINWANPSARNEMINRLKKDGSVTNYEADFVAKSGKIKSCLVSVKLYPREGYLEGTTMDITAHRQAEENYRILFREMLDGFALHEIICDKNGRPVDYRFLAVNPAFERLTGLKADLLEGRTVLEALPGTEQHWIETYGRVALTGQPTVFENYHSQLKKYFEVTAFRPAPNQFACIFADITERKRAEVSLRESEEKHRRLFETMTQGIVYHAADGAIISANPAAERILGLSIDQLCGKTSMDPRWKMIREDGSDVAGTEHPTMTALRTGLAVGPVIRGVFQPEKNDYIWLSITAIPLFQPGETTPFQVYATFDDITDRKRAEETLRKKDALLANLASQVPGMLFQFMRKPDGTYCVPYSSINIKNIFGCSPEDVHDNFEPIFSVILPEDRDKVTQTIDESISNLSPWMCEYRVQIPGQSVKWIFGNSIPEKMADGSIVWSGYDMDITDRKRAEEEKIKLEGQFHQAQKMESVGRLAGGVAHDFNNMLGIIIGHAEMALEHLDPSHPLFADLRQIRKAAERSANLTQQLLAFARKQTVAPRVLDPNETVEGMLKMLRRLIGEDIDLAWISGSDVWPLKMDPSQIDQILANLCVNARDAITDVGKVTIETGNKCFDAEFCAKHTGFIEGDYVLLSVSDNGCGMSKEILDKLFEPFFTTKEMGKGTGLGLATVFGIVKQNNGFISVYSEVGHGTTFNIYLPRHVGKARHLQQEAAVEPVVRGHETILLTEDDPAILKMTAMMLEKLGYKVLCANTPGEAIRLAREHAGHIHLLITDVVMPEMNGRDLAKNLLSLYPHLKRLFMSGYTADVIAHHGVLEEGVCFIQKPFYKKDLATKVRAALDR